MLYYLQLTFKWTTNVIYNITVTAILIYDHKCAITIIEYFFQSKHMTIVLLELSRYEVQNVYFGHDTAGQMQI